MSKSLKEMKELAMQTLGSFQTQGAMRWPLGLEKISERGELEDRVKQELWRVLV